MSTTECDINVRSSYADSACQTDLFGITHTAIMTNAIPGVVPQISRSARAAGTQDNT
jgi:hypothetical protein